MPDRIVVVAGVVSAVLPSDVEPVDRVQTKAEEGQQGDVSQRYEVGPGICVLVRLKADFTAGAEVALGWLRAAAAGRSWRSRRLRGRWSGRRWDRGALLAGKFLSELPVQYGVMPGVVDMGRR